ncbi:hypothetical protein [Rhizobium halophilum]|uniref:hypothetical protein n=1 Tax=Rhizobium halophilum TaxID=2846852 RepID=UPI001EFDE6BE|nr:hypothetical protein [Rhizobium halophilum]MCF6368329.1 hypothetical protein [Rhizobium halophilum]
MSINKLIGPVFTSAAQITAAAIVLGFFCGSTSLIGRWLVLPGLIGPFELADVISHALIVAPVAFVAVVMTIIQLRNIDNVGRFSDAKLTLFAAAATAVIAILAETGGIIPGSQENKRPVFQFIAASYMLLAIVIAIVLFQAHRLSFAGIYLLIGGTYFLGILGMSALATFLDATTPDEAYPLKGLLCVEDHCAPGRIVVGFSRFSVIRWDGSSELVTIPSARIKSFSTSSVTSHTIPSAASAGASPDAPQPPPTPLPPAP